MDVDQSQTDAKTKSWQTLEKHFACRGSTFLEASIKDVHSSPPPPVIRSPLENDLLPETPVGLDLVSLHHIRNLGAKATGKATGRQVGPGC